jgi:hypothetical protein
MAGVSAAVGLGSALYGAVQGANGGGSSGGIPRWQRKAMKGLYGDAGDVAQGMSVAPFNADQQAAMGGIRNAGNYLGGWYKQATNQANDLAQGINAGDVSKFYNPYEQDVVGAYLKDVNTMHGQEDLRVNDAAEAAKAFGGDREAVYRAVSQGQIDDNAERNLAGIRSTGYQTALQAALQNHGLQLTGNAQLQQLLDARRANHMQDLGALMQSGTMQQELAQRMRDLPQARLQFQQSMMQPYYNPPSQPYDPVAGAITGFQGGYDMGSDIGGLLSRVLGNSRAMIPQPSGGISINPGQFPMPSVPTIFDSPSVYTNPYPRI